jgi:Protein of unknown function (DUF4240)
MTIDEFWKLIDHVDKAALQKGEGFDDDAVAPLLQALVALSRPELEAFSEHLAVRLYNIDGIKFSEASNVNSDDGFLYQRCFVVAMGRKFYDQVRNDPSLMPSSIDQWCEPLLFVASNAWKQQTGDELDCTTSVSFESGSNRAQW